MHITRNKIREDYDAALTPLSPMPRQVWDWLWKMHGYATAWWCDPQYFLRVPKEEMMIELEKTIPYWWEKIADKHQQIVRISDSAPAHVIRAEREGMGRMYKQLQTYVHHEQRLKFKGWTV